MLPTALKSSPLVRSNTKRRFSPYSNSHLPSVPTLYVSPKSLFPGHLGVSPAPILHSPCICTILSQSFPQCAPQTPWLPLRALPLTSDISFSAVISPTLESMWNVLYGGGNFNSTPEHYWTQRFLLFPNTVSPGRKRKGRQKTQRTDSGSAIGQSIHADTGAKGHLEKPAWNHQQTLLQGLKVLTWCKTGRSHTRLLKTGDWQSQERGKTIRSSMQHSTELGSAQAGKGGFV